MQHETSAVAGALATRKEWVGLAVLGLPTLLLSIDIGVLYLALPNITKSLGADTTQQLWILDIYSFLLAGFLVTMGNLGDRIGRRKLLIIGGVAFAAASLLAAFSPTAESLIAARALLGIAGATIMPSTMALIRNMFPDPKQMGTALGAWFACFMGGMLLGPLVGGALLEHFWWGSAFLIGVPVMALLVILAPIFLPEYKAVLPSRLDFGSVVLSLAAILPAIYGLKELARNGWSVVPAGAIVVGLVFALMFVRRQSRLDDPLLDLALFRNRIFSTSLLMMLIGGLVMAGISLVSAIYLQSVLGLSPLAAGLWLIPQNVAMVIGFQVAPALTRKYSVPSVIATGLIIGAIGFGALTQLSTVDGAGLLVVGVTLAAFGITFPMSLLTALMLGATPPDKAGAASSVNEMSGEFGIALGIATLGSVATIVYRTQLGDAMPGAISDADSTLSLESIAAALQVAADLPGGLGSELADAARAAFTSGVEVIGGVGAIAFLALAATAIAVLRPRPVPVADAVAVGAVTGG